VRDIQDLLDPLNKQSRAEPKVEPLSLWDPDLGPLPAGVNYGDDTWASNWPAKEDR